MSGTKRRGGKNEVSINTGAVEVAVRTLSTINRRFDTDFNSAQSSMNSLKATWSSSAANKAIDKFNKMKQTYVGPEGQRSMVMEQYIKFLAEAVDIGYETTESENKKLSELFK
ncbi:MAG: hypothetical protein IKE65_01120 [Clostridia bacterium]|nr:hypothetical protein [Clostridia bacterium]